MEKLSLDALLFEPNCQVLIDLLLVSEGKLSVMHALSLAGKFLCHFYVVHPKLSQQVSTESG